MPDQTTAPGAFAPGVSLPSPIPFVECLNYSRSRRTAVDIATLHDMEAPEKGTTAMDTALWMAGKNPKFPAPYASANYFLDDREVVQGVHEYNVAWHAPGVNPVAVGLEHAGFARQTPDEWLDAFGLNMLELSCLLCAAICRRWNIPAVLLDEAALLLPRPRGITLHRTVTAAFHRSNHQDPGPNFPAARYVARVAELLAAPPS
ncbi:MAG: N-acetylmuramoyl-L-alanine amidase [Thermoplasmata archaeon]|nr:N-acetylmuramoyl-L-alanine amidase [Thermoplasmata archaeon]MCI4354834.1 N-acetylmuramoyl-L-alanine amidase [Thermoplasmata archaeon]